MKQARLSGIVVSILLWFVSAVSAQVGGAVPDFVESLTEPGQGLTVASVSAHTGYATFASSTGRGILLAMPANASAEERAVGFMRTYGHAFGIENASEVRTLRAADSDDLGFEHIRLQQVHNGIPIRGAELIVHMKGPRVMAANGHGIRDLPANVVPSVAAHRAGLAARRLLAKRGISDADTATYREPQLEILNRTLISGLGNDRSHLAWFIEVTGPALREYVWVDAQTGAILLQFSQLTDAKNRSVYNANHISGVLPGTLVRSEGGPATGDADQDLAYTFAGVTYDYFKNDHNRDSYDNAGAELRSSAHYCKDPDCPTYPNAFWNGQQMVYGDGYASADDVVGHELTHAVTERTAGLLYYMQSGALNESFSDIFGEAVDLTDVYGNDAANVRWLMGEDLTIGAIRSMTDPTLFSDPGKMSDSTFFVCSTTGWTDGSQDRGGVHTNSGVPNHAFALMVDGGTYNGTTVSGIGLTKAAKIEYRALTVYLTSGAGFLDDYNALNRSCTDLLGVVGITSGDCTQVKNALDAVEMSIPWGCIGSVQAPAKCPSETVSLTTIEGFENSIGNWTASNDLGTWTRDTGLASSGVWSAYGTDPDGTSVHSLAMTNAVTIPSGGRLYIDHVYEFENSFDGLNVHLWDGGIVEYSADGGTTWLDAGSLVDAGAGYDGTLEATNPLGARLAFTGGSYGYTGTRLNLASLAGLNVKFRFRIASDAAVSSLGWLIDNIAVYRCTTPTPFTDDPIVAGVTPIKAVHINELRNRINANRVARGLTLSAWTDLLTVGATPIKAVHINDLRAALNAAYAAAGRPQPSFTDPALTSGMTSKALHVNELRAALIAVESPP